LLLLLFSRLSFHLFLFGYLPACCVISANVLEVRRHEAVQPIGEKPCQLSAPESLKIRSLQSHLQNVRDRFTRELPALHHGSFTKSVVFRSLQRIELLLFSLLFECVIFFPDRFQFYTYSCARAEVGLIEGMQSFNPFFFV
jgi:hypothetical protein